MSGSTAARKAAVTVDPDETIVPIHHPKRLPYRPTIPARELRNAVVRVVRARQAREREAALTQTGSNENAQ